MTLFNSTTKSGELRFGRDSKFQRIWYWLPPNAATGVKKVAVFSRGGTLFRPGVEGMLEVAPGDTEDIASMLLNEFDMVLITHDIRPGGVRVPTGNDPDALYFPEVLEDFALCVQYLKSIAYDESIWGAGNTLSLNPDDWFRFGSSSGGWGAGYTQLMRDGDWPYAASGSIGTDPYVPRHNHLCNVIYLLYPQTNLSAFNQGVSGGSKGEYATYQEYSWAGAYLFDSRKVVNPPDVPTWGWNQFPTHTKIKADFDEHLYPENPRIKDIAFYLANIAISGNSIVNMSGNVTSGFEYQQWRGAYYPSGQNKPAPSTGYYSLHDPWQTYWLFHRLQKLGNTRSIMRAGNATTNPDPTTRYNLATTGDLRTWLTGTLGWIIPS